MIRHNCSIYFGISKMENAARFKRLLHSHYGSFFIMYDHYKTKNCRATKLQPFLAKKYTVEVKTPL